jgi:hypothetical protein
VPAEAIHLSALEDSLERDRALRRAIDHDDAELTQLLRLGAVLVDLAYFDRFALGVARYLLGRPIATSPIGDRLHQHRPVLLGKLLVRHAAVLRTVRSSRRDGQRLLALGLGHLSHVAVDSRLHPLVNQLAGVRAARLGERAARQHNEVEKFHSILFHEERLGFDFMGRSQIADYIHVEASVLHDGGALDLAYRRALALVHDLPLPQRTLRRWTRGYAQYGRLLASRFGGRVMPQAVKEAVRGEVYDRARFVAHYGQAVERSTRYLEAGLGLASANEDDRFDAIVPEGSIDDPPYATDAHRGLIPLALPA